MLVAISYTTDIIYYNIIPLVFGVFLNFCQKDTVLKNNEILMETGCLIENDILYMKEKDIEKKFLKDTECQSIVRY